MPRTPSIAYQHVVDTFDENGRTAARKCKHCGIKLSHSGTTPTIAHLRQKHPLLLTTQNADTSDERVALIMSYSLEDAGDEEEGNEDGNDEKKDEARNEEEHEGAKESKQQERVAMDVNEEKDGDDEMMQSSDAATSTPTNNCTSTAAAAASSPSSSSAPARRCRSCFQLYPYADLHPHPLGSVLGFPQHAQCEPCRTIYESGSWGWQTSGAPATANSQGDEKGKDQYCRICGEGSLGLLMCDKSTCTYSYCESCVIANCGLRAYKEIDDLAKRNEWNCFRCERVEFKKAHPNAKQLTSPTHANRKVTKRGRHSNSNSNTAAASSSSVHTSADAASIPLDLPDNSLLPHDSPNRFRTHLHLTARVAVGGFTQRTAFDPYHSLKRCVMGFTILDRQKRREIAALRKVCYRVNLSTNGNASPTKVSNKRKRSKDMIDLTSPSDAAPAATAASSHQFTFASSSSPSSSGSSSSGSSSELDEDEEQIRPQSIAISRHKRRTFGSNRNAKRGEKERRLRELRWEQAAVGNATTKTAVFPSASITAASPSTSATSALSPPSRPLTLRRLLCFTFYLHEYSDPERHLAYMFNLLHTITYLHTHWNGWTIRLYYDDSFQMSYESILSTTSSTVTPKGFLCSYSYHCIIRHIWYNILMPLFKRFESTVDGHPTGWFECVRVNYSHFIDRNEHAGHHGSMNDILPTMSFMELGRYSRQSHSILERIVLGKLDMCWEKEKMKEMYEGDWQGKHHVRLYDPVYHGGKSTVTPLWSCGFGVRVPKEYIESVERKYSPEQPKHAYSRTPLAASTPSAALFPSPSQIWRNPYRHLESALMQFGISHARHPMVLLNKLQKSAWIKDLASIGLSSISSARFNKNANDDADGGDDDSSSVPSHLIHSGVSGATARQLRDVSIQYEEEVRCKNRDSFVQQHQSQPHQLGSAGLKHSKPEERKSNRPTLNISRDSPMDEEAFEHKEESKQQHNPASSSRPPRLHPSLHHREELKEPSRPSPPADDDIDGVEDDECQVIEVETFIPESASSSETPPALMTPQPQQQQQSALIDAGQESGDESTTIKQEAKSSQKTKQRRKRAPARMFSSGTRARNGGKKSSSSSSSNKPHAAAAVYEYFPYGSVEIFLAEYLWPLVRDDCYSFPVRLPDLPSFGKIGSMKHPMSALTLEEQQLRTQAIPFWSCVRWVSPENDSSLKYLLEGTASPVVKGTGAPPTFALPSVQSSRIVATVKSYIARHWRTFLIERASLSPITRFRQQHPHTPLTFHALQPSSLVCYKSNHSLSSEFRSQRVECLQPFMSARVKQQKIEEMRHERDEIIVKKEGKSTSAATSASRGNSSRGKRKTVDDDSAPATTEPSSPPSTQHKRTRREPPRSGTRSTGASSRMKSQHRSSHHHRHHHHHHHHRHHDQAKYEEIDADGDLTMDMPLTPAVVVTTVTAVAPAKVEPVEPPRECASPSTSFDVLDFSSTGILAYNEDEDEEEIQQRSNDHSMHVDEEANDGATKPALAEHIDPPSYNAAVTSTSSAVATPSKHEDEPEMKQQTKPKTTGRKTQAAASKL